MHVHNYDLMAFWKPFHHNSVHPIRIAILGTSAGHLNCIVYMYNSLIVLSHFMVL